MLNVGTTADLRLNIPSRETSCPIVYHDNVHLTQWVAVLMAIDIIGIVSIAVVVFRVYASPLGYDDGQLWAGLAAFLVGWIVAAWTQSLYGRKTLLTEARALSANGLVACALTFGIVLLLGFSFKFMVVCRVSGYSPGLWAPSCGSAVCVFCGPIVFADR